MKIIRIAGKEIRHCEICGREVEIMSQKAWEYRDKLCKECGEKIDQGQERGLDDIGFDVVEMASNDSKIIKGAEDARFNLMEVTSGNYCGGFRPPKGHLDTQMFPECEGYETDRNIVRKTVERRKESKQRP